MLQRYAEVLRWALVAVAPAQCPPRSRVCVAVVALAMDAGHGGLHPLHVGRRVSDKNLERTELCKVVQRVVQRVV